MLDKILKKARELWRGIDPDRLKQTTLEFLKIPSPTTREVDFSRFLAQEMGRAGMSVEMTRESPESPNIIGRLPCGEGKRLQFDGHTDTIDKSHDTPSYEDGVIYGRGACDMKGALAAMIEMAHVLSSSSVRLKGEIAITAHGLHEAPLGTKKSVAALIEKGYIGDAVVVGECADRILPVEGNGMSIFEIAVRRKGGVLHELKGRDVSNPLFVGSEIMNRLKIRSAELSGEKSHKIPPSLFVGILSGGDLYNRIPVECRIVGTRRYHHDRSFKEIEGEIKEITSASRCEKDITICTTVNRIVDGFVLSEKERIVSSLRKAYRMATGKTLEIGAINIGGDLPQYLSSGHIPGVYHGLNQDSAHADIERVSLDELIRITRVYLAICLVYLGFCE